MFLSSVLILTHLILTIVCATWAVPTLWDIMHENIIHQTQQRAKGKIGVQSLEMLVGHLKRPLQGLLSPAAFRVAEVLRSFSEYMA